MNKLEILKSWYSNDVKPCPDVKVNGEDYPPLVDQMSANDYNVNASGFLMSDITALSRANDSSEIDNILHRLNEMRQDIDNSDLSDEELLAKIRPRYAQDPVDYARWLDAMNELDLKELSHRLNDKDQVTLSTDGNDDDNDTSEDS